METLGIQTFHVNKECAEIQNSNSIATATLALSSQLFPPPRDSSSFVDSEGWEEVDLPTPQPIPKEVPCPWARTDKSQREESQTGITWEKAGYSSIKRVSWPHPLPHMRKNHTAWSPISNRCHRGIAEESWKMTISSVRKRREKIFTEWWWQQSFIKDIGRDCMQKMIFISIITP